MIDFARWVCVGCALGTGLAGICIGAVAPQAGAYMLFISGGFCFVAMILAGFVR